MCVEGRAHQTERAVSVSGTSRACAQHLSLLRVVAVLVLPTSAYKKNPLQNFMRRLHRPIIIAAVIAAVSAAVNVHAVICPPTCELAFWLPTVNSLDLARRMKQQRLE